MSLLKSLESLGGFSSAVKAIDQVPQDLLLEMCQDVIAMLQYKTSFIPLDHYKMCLKRTDSGESIEPQLVVNGLTHIFRSAAIAKVTGESLYNDLKTNGGLREQVLTTLKHVWSDQGHLVSHLNTEQSFNVGQLLDIQWKLCVGMSSSHCKGLKSPYINALVQSTDSFGKISNHSFEMTLSEFKKFATEMRDISCVMETM
ncbi:COMM domain-containing protein 6-like [Dendronephthya gigantea]|uniref:COMM domain-containing protein 6-like n=1 Tax=Dendronephthya gigantea TaxID=151771 RepID=UPI00106D1A41|nr:COMM domain-containing protein 6-like [Dendronephthya gigantea]